MLSFALVGHFVRPVAPWLRALALIAGLAAIFLVEYHWAVALAAPLLLVGFYAFQKRAEAGKKIGGSEVAG